LVLSGGNFSKHLSVLGKMNREWDKINRQTLKRAIQGLYESKLVDIKEDENGNTRMVLSYEGKQKILSYKVDELKISVPKKWDKKWRLVIFDIPEKFKQGREALRMQLKNLGFHQLQKSILIFPYDCRNEVEFLIELYSLRPYVRYAVVESIDNELHLKDLFRI